MKAEAPSYLEGSGAWPAFNEAKAKHGVEGKDGTMWNVSASEPDERYVEVTLVVRFDRGHRRTEANLVLEGGAPAPKLAE